MNKKIGLLLGFPVLYEVLGIILLVFSDEALRFLCYSLAAVMLVMGISAMITYMRRSVQENLGNNSLSIGLCMVVIGTLTLVKTELLIYYIPFAFAVMILINGVREMQSAVDFLRLRLENAWIALLMALVNLAVGIVLILKPVDDYQVWLILLGVGMIVSGMEDFVISLVLYIRSKDENSHKKEIIAEE